MVGGRSGILLLFLVWVQVRLFAGGRCFGCEWKGGEGYEYNGCAFYHLRSDDVLLRFAPFYLYTFTFVMVICQSFCKIPSNPKG